MNVDHILGGILILCALTTGTWMSIKACVELHKNRGRSLSNTKKEENNE